jgi:hypothetical protein
MTGVARAIGTRRGMLTARSVVIGVLASLAVAAPAMAGLRNDLRRFSDCPYNTFGVSKCVYSDTTSGVFKLGKGETPITVPVVIQGGIAGNGELIAATDGNTLSKSAEPVPGGLTGFGFLPSEDEEVTATAELAGPAFLTSEAILNLKAHLKNPSLGENCFIGSDAEPIHLDLLYGADMATSFKDKTILVVKGTLEDSTFEAPGANGCTATPPVGDTIIDEKQGLPAKSGNKAVQTGVTEEVSRRTVKDVLPLPDFGRCVKVLGETVGKEIRYHGGYLTAACTAPSVTNDGKYEWVPGPGPSPKFTGTSPATTLQAVGGNPVKCTSSSESGEYTGAKTETATITFSGCAGGPKTAPVKCQSSGAAAGEIKTAALEGSLDFIKENEEGVKPIVGVDFKAPGNLVSFECGGEATSVSGSLIAPITNVDVMGSTFKVTAKQTSGKQAVAAFEESSPDTPLFKTGATENAGGLGATLTNTNAEKMEIKAED